MTDRTESALREALHERGEQISPTPALPGILHRAARARSPRRGWLPIGAVALGAAGLITAGVLVFAPGAFEEPEQLPAGGDPTSDSVDDSSDDESVSVEVLSVEPGSKVPTAIYYAHRETGELVGAEEIVVSTGDVGVDALTTLFSSRPSNQTVFCNLWSGLGDSGRPAEPVAEVRSVTRSEGFVNVDLDRSVADPFPAASTVCSGEPTVQQLVLTVTSALRTDDPVQVTVRGVPADTIFGTPVDGPVAPDHSALAGIRPDVPEQAATVSSPVVVSGESNTFEGTVVLDVYQDGERVKREIGTFGAYEYAPYSFSVDLEPGQYTLKLYAEDAASGPESLSPVLYPVFRDITVG